MKLWSPHIEFIDGSPVPRCTLAAQMSSGSAADGPLQPVAAHSGCTTDRSSSPTSSRVGSLSKGSRRTTSHRGVRGRTRTGKASARRYGGSA